MDIAAGMIISFSALIYSVSNSIFVGIPLILSFLIFSVISLKRGFSARDILSMSYEGSRKAFVVLRIFIGQYYARQQGHYLIWRPFGCDWRSQKAEQIK